MLIFIFILLSIIQSISSQLENAPFLQSEFARSFTAYGPGLGVFTPYSYVDMFYDNIPFVGKIPVLGKDGTSSRTGISPFYPVNGNPSNPFPPLYKARPLPIHAPDPVEVVAVPLDEEALHGEKLFPDELVLPWLRENATTPGEKKTGKPTGGSETEEPAPNPFGDLGVENFSETKKPVKSNKESEEFEDDEIVPLSKTEKKIERVKDIKNDSAEYEDEEAIIKQPSKIPKFAVIKKILSR